ncbi:MAG: 3-keto-5-aminohexanoate cleavage protein [Planctomycetes bacterium]|nr:3-keto-5-aminohexanoate cleavage protein [Planctomycetota bacterium]
MSPAKKIVVTAALTGVAANRKQCPHLPYTPAEIAAEAKRAHDAGAAIVHIHGREDDGRPSFRPELFAEIRDRIRADGPVLLNFSTGAIGLSMDERTAHIRRAPPEMAALNMGSMNYAIYSEKAKKFHFEAVFHNSFPEIVQCVTALAESGVRPELECFDLGHIGNTRPLVDLGLLKDPLQFSLILGVLGGIPASTRNLVTMQASLPPRAIWQVIGIGDEQWPLVAAALSMGGNVRVGMEDNFYLSAGIMARSNGDLVEKAVRMARDVGLEPASAPEAREMLGLGGGRAS